ncbi:MAG: dihydrouridine synthase dus [uncultured bacterium]|nr:MAG: dihydrouridine synthase dus [uncultured bacterium]
MINFWKKLPRPFTALAPMEDVTDFIFREIVATELPRPDVMFTEFTNVEALNSEGFDKTIHRFKFSEAQRPIVAQIWGMKSENYYKTAKLIVKLGFDGIDINMGCPDKAVVKIGACSALINNHPLAKKIIKATKKGAGNLPVSVKTRIGLTKVVTQKWITFLLEQKLDAITIHGRTSKQMSDVPTNWNEIKKIVEIKNKISPETIIIGNGGIKNYGDGIKKSKKYGADGAMIATGVLKNPWAFEKKNTKHTLEENIEILVKHLNLYKNTSDVKKRYDVLKKFFKMYINNTIGASTLRAKLMATKTIDKALEILK